MAYTQFPGWWLFVCPSFSVLAAAVFAFRSENLMEVTSLASAEVVTYVCVCVCVLSNTKIVSSLTANTSNPVHPRHMFQNCWDNHF